MVAVASSKFGQSPRRSSFFDNIDIKRIGEAVWKRSYERVVEAAMLHDDAVHCIFAGAGKTRRPLHLCVLALGIFNGRVPQIYKCSDRSPEYKPARCKHLKFGLPFAHPFPSIPSLVNGQEWCLPFSFNSINTLTVRYVIPPYIESDCQY